MMRFRCPSCQHILELAQFTQAVLCPACQQWCRIPTPAEFELSNEPIRRPVKVRPEPRGEPRLAGVDQPEEILDVLAVPEGADIPPRDAITAGQPEEPPVRFRDEADDIEDVEFEVIREGEGQPRKPRRRRRRRRSSFGGINLEYWTSPSLILLLVMAPPALLFSLIFFFVHPAMGIGCLLMTGGGIWFTAIAAEDGLVTALLVLFVPFYAWYYTINNWERVAIPFLLQLIGTFIFFLSMGIMKSRMEDRWSCLPTPIVRTLTHPIG